VPGGEFRVSLGVSEANFIDGQVATNVLPRNGGHTYIRRAMGDPPTARLVGGALRLDTDGTLTVVSWNSRSTQYCNTIELDQGGGLRSYPPIRTGGRPDATELNPALRPLTMRLLGEATGRTVFDGQ